MIKQWIPASPLLHEQHSRHSKHSRSKSWFVYTMLGCSGEMGFHQRIATSTAIEHHGAGIGKVEQSSSLNRRLLTGRQRNCYVSDLLLIGSCHRWNYIVLMWKHHCVMSKHEYNLYQLISLLLTFTAHWNGAFGERVHVLTTIALIWIILETSSLRFKIFWKIISFSVNILEWS